MWQQIVCKKPRLGLRFDSIYRITSCRDSEDFIQIKDIEIDGNQDSFKHVVEAFNQYQRG